METVKEIEADKLERLSLMYGKELGVQIGRLRDALAEFDAKRSFGDWLTARNIADRINELMIMRNAVRTHSDSFREKFPDSADVLDQP